MAMVMVMVMGIGMATAIGDRDGGKQEKIVASNGKGE